ncbi:pyrroline-5-carboxylate reductase [Pseudalkalibacillus caeni]|uniref:Pyrroline-5-carboxylate reductase n=1 Tax=Exobacillus caeni TaxID=2574798 RepID=A0A5R9F681_9BACL|nr:pyrroline-5-carboxylate reductase [Pseudalkalibacillus caeni]TLS39067.1 pyrroline-5-carboxylate reductase [Pseudalkalibacillus caeni]
MLENKTVSFIGAGSMAEAMVAGIVDSKMMEAQDVIVTNRSNEERREELMAKYGVMATKSVEFAVKEADIVILAMKPKDIEAALLSIKEHMTKDQVLLTVLAGVPLEYYQDILGNEQPVIRVMPNTSSTIGQSISALAPGDHATMDHVLAAKKLIESIGEAVVINEDQMDVFTGVAGSGPAYIYYVIEHLEQAAVNGGIEQETARKMAVQTVLGASMMVNETNEAPAALRKKVTSPNGTTQAGLEALDENGGAKAVRAAVKNAADRSKEISEQFSKKPELV